jgi:hypothetical protein
MDYRQVAERLGVSASTAYLMIREGGRGFFRVQADGTVQAEDLEAFVLEAVYGLTALRQCPNFAELAGEQGGIRYNDVRTKGTESGHRMGFRGTEWQISCHRHRNDSDGYRWR